MMEKSQRMNPGLPGPSGETPIWEEPVRGFYTDLGQFVTLSGLDLLRSMLDGGLGPPVRYLSGLELTSVEPGGVTFTMPVTDWLLFPQGVISGATLAILADAPAPPVARFCGIVPVEAEAGDGDPSRPEHGDRHLGGVRRRRQEGCRRDRLVRDPAGPASDGDN